MTALRIRVGGNGHKWAVADCACGATVSTLNDAQESKLRQRIIARGWTFEGDRARCPKCAATEAIKESAMDKVMTRADRRAVVEKLQEVYLNEVTGYSPGWTDAKVAAEIDRPRAWVAQIREEMFGPEKANEDIRAALAAAKAVLADIKSVDSLLSELRTRAEKIERVIIAIEDSLQ